MAEQQEMWRVLYLSWAEKVKLELIKRGFTQKGADSEEQRNNYLWTVAYIEDLSPDEFVTQDYFNAETDNQ